MRKSTKGALAGVAAAFLLMSGLGTHAAWQGSTIIGGSAINTGVMSLDQTCGSWKLGVLTGTLDTVNNTVNGTVAGLADVTGTVANLKLTPGDLLQRICTITVHIQGTRLTTADLTLNSPTLTGGGSSLNAIAEYKTGTNTLSTGATLSDGQVITATLSVNLKDGLTGVTGQNLNAQLQDISVIANPN